MVREAVESRRGCRLRRRCCVAIPPLGPWCVRGLWERQCLVLGQLLLVTPASWLKAPKRRGGGRRTSLSLALREREGTTEKGQLAGQIACPNRSCSWQLPPARRRRRCWLPMPSLRRGGVSRGGGVSALLPRLLRSFSGTFWSRGYLSPAWKWPWQEGGLIKIHMCHLFSGEKVWCQALRRKAVDPVFRHLLRVYQVGTAGILGWVPVCKMCAQQRRFFLASA